MGLQFEKEIEDVRGKILFCKYNKLFLNLIEMKKGYARGGHYHKYDQEHFIISGKVEYRNEEINTKKETIQIIDQPTLIHIPAYTAHLLIGIEDTIFVESFPKDYEVINYQKYRKIVEEKMNS